jgi:hypothetical protein
VGIVEVMFDVSLVLDFAETDEMNCPEFSDPDYVNKK